MPPDLIIQPCRPQDQEPARDLILSGLKEHFGFADRSLNPDLDEILVSYAEGHFLCAWLDRVLVGTGALVRNTQRVACVSRMSVDLSHRRQGIGSMVLLQLLELARSDGYEAATLVTNGGWHEVIAFYERHGFREDHRNGLEVHFRVELALH